ncbi:transposable element Tcb2 transposase [Trichonephila clavipes]|nr:transposable element Tcb2 transposase [Trichonephila clavipes]
MLGPHTARVSQDCFRTVTPLPWPVQSPVLSPIEHIWDHLGRRVGHPTSLNEHEASSGSQPSGHGPVSVQGSNGTGQTKEN